MVDSDSRYHQSAPERSSDLIPIIPDRQLLLTQGQQHISEAITLAQRSLYSDTYPRIASYLRSTGLSLPMELQEMEKPIGWRESLWNRGDSISTQANPYIEGLEDGQDPTPVLVREIAQIDESLVESANTGYYARSINLASAEIGLTRVVGVAVDISNFGMAESVIDRIRVLAQEDGDTDDALADVLADSLAECLVYLGVAKIRKGLPELGTEHPSESLA